MRRTPEFQDFLRRHAGVFRRRDALGCGITPKRFELGTQNKEWVRYRGLWILADISQSRSSVIWAALLKAGTGARLTGASCLQLHGVQPSIAEIHVSAPAGSRAAVQGAVILRDRDRTRVNGRVQGFPTVSRSRAVVDALRILDDREARDVLHEALRQRWISVNELAWWSKQLRGHNGMTRFRRQLKYAKSGTLAESEALMLRLLRRARIDKGWQFNRPIFGPTGQLTGIGDCVHSAASIVIELDGMAWHTANDRFQRDRTKQNELVNNGWRVFRFTWADLTQRPDQVIGHIQRALNEQHGQQDRALLSL